MSPQIVLPEQFVRPARCGARESGSHRLMLGVLRDAAELYCKACDPRSRVPPRRVHEVLAWFASRDRTWPFSFDRICEALGFDPDYLRRGLRRRAANQGAFHEGLALWRPAGSPWPAAPRGRGPEGLPDPAGAPP